MLPLEGGDDFLLDRSLIANEDEESSELFEIELGIEVRSNRKQEDDCEESWFSFDFRKSNHCVYVGISDNFDSSMDALQWTLDFAVLPSTIVYLFHVFPELRFVPSPLGMLPKSQVSPKLVEKFKAEERAKRKEFLHKFVDKCYAAQVNVEVVMIESDMVAKAILDLISLLQIRKLILGSTKARKWRSRRGKGIARHVLQNAQEFCDVKIICEGKESTYQAIESSSSSSSSSHTPSPNLSDKNIHFKSHFKNTEKEYHRSGFLTWRCFGG
ncbi:U-box domain-containing protein 35-like [Benincasa hispida]|uniref:U-box domain-containing protein 35-like n=1 Tax=Benincasa hispida TaxID=102211 RepID=UPI001902005D|nr:U-box domain-containing protein 35-like [Benincasa hispida]